MTERERILAIIEREGITSKAFAEKAGIGAATISNIAGGRNNASLEVLQKIAAAYPNYSLRWIFLGVGEMVADPKADTLPIVSDESSSISIIASEKNKPEPKFEIKNEEKEQPQNEVAPKSVSKIVIFYSDGTYEMR